MHRCQLRSLQGPRLPGQEVVGTIGLPGTVNRTVTHDQWVYGDKLYFDNDLLVSFHD
jgi:hypothetical protein